jgi:hypothetical protein
MSVISLRAAGLRLEKASRGPKSKVGFDRLFGYLQSGGLRAGIFAPPPIDQWVEIPADHWKKRTLKDFQSLKAARGGGLEIRLSDLNREGYGLLPGGAVDHDATKALTRDLRRRRATAKAASCFPRRHVEQYQ